MSSKRVLSATTVALRAFRLHAAAHTLCHIFSLSVVWLSPPADQTLISGPDPLSGACVFG